MDKYVLLVNLSSLLNSSWWLAIFVIYFHLDESYPIKCAWTDPQNNGFPLKLINTVHFGISWSNVCSITLLYEVLSGKAYHIYFFRKIHVCTMRLKFWNTFCSIYWEFSNQPSTMDKNIFMQKILNHLLNIILYILLPYFWII